MARKNRFRLILITDLILIGLVAALAVQRWLLVDLPHPETLYQYTMAPSTKIYDRHGTLLYEITDPHQGLHTPLRLTDIPPACVEATIATEDASFYQNPGVDGWAIVRALYANLKGGEIVSGGSTITQQLARNLLLSPQERAEISLTRKMREAILAWRLARTYSKADILTLYLNEIYYGNLAYGLEAASRAYFGKGAAELDLAECAMLAGLPQSPANYNPLHQLEAAKGRQQTVLDLMVKGGFLTAERADAAHREKLGFAAAAFPIKAPHFVMFIREELAQTYGLEAIYRQGLQVHTTLDLNIQRTARQIVGYQLAALAERQSDQPPRNVHNAAVVVMAPETGEILAMLGSPDYFEPDIDGAVNVAIALRQPGSALKPLTYAAAFDPEIAAAAGYEPLTPASLMMDVRTAFVTREGDPYAPENYDRTWHGPVLLRQALANSYNLVAVKVLDYIGPETLIDLAQAMGLTTFDHTDFGLALTLGGGEVRLLELTTAYGVLANGGRQLEPVAIQRITDHQGKVIYQVPDDQAPGPSILDSRTAYLITHILSDNDARRPAFGANSPLRLDRPAAAKTGTSQDWRDNWTLGYTPDFVVGVWAGNADNQPMGSISGVTGAAPIWHDLMAELHKGRPIRHFSQPEGLVEATICRDNGLKPVAQARPLATSAWQSSSQADEAGSAHLTIPAVLIPCPHTLTERFIRGTEPRQSDGWHQALALDWRTGLRAGPGCHLDFVTWRTFTRYPAEIAAWARKRDAPLPPDGYSPHCPEEGESASGESAGGESASELVSASIGQPFLAEATVASSPALTGPVEGLIFTSPDQGSIFRIAPNIPADKQQIQVSARPVDGVTLRQVSLLVNGQLLAEGPQTMWPIAPGVYTFEAVGVDAAGNAVRSNRVTVEVRE